MDDVLDSFRFIHMHGDIYGCVPLMVSLLLRGEDSARPLAFVASYKRIFDSLQEVCASGTLQARTG